jgi:hypothetical protein
MGDPQAARVRGANAVFLFLHCHNRTVFVHRVAAPGTSIRSVLFIPIVQPHKVNYIDCYLVVRNWSLNTFIFRNYLTKFNLQFLETGLQTPLPSFFRNQFL